MSDNKADTLTKAVKAVIRDRNLEFEDKCNTAQKLVNMMKKGG